MKDYNYRQIKKMYLQICEFKNKNIDIKSLVGDLLFLRDALLEVSPDWERSFTSNVADLESAYIYMYEKNIYEPDSLTQKIIDKSLSNLTKLIDSYQK